MHCHTCNNWVCFQAKDLERTADTEPKAKQKLVLKAASTEPAPVEREKTTVSDSATKTTDCVKQGTESEAATSSSVELEAGNTKSTTKSTESMPSKSSSVKEVKVCQLCCAEVL